MANSGHWFSYSHFVCGVLMKYDRITQFEFLHVDETQDNIKVQYKDQCDKIDERAVNLEELAGWWKEKGCGECIAITVAVQPVGYKRDETDTG